MQSSHFAYFLSSLIFSDSDDNEGTMALTAILGESGIVVVLKWDG